MSFVILIDGYNLLFTAGFEGLGRGRGWLEHARQRLLKHLEMHLPHEQHAKTLVVFDVSVDILKARARELEDDRSPFQVANSGIQVAFAFDYDEADDMLENLIRKHPAPKKLRVVSSDNRIRKCALARRAVAIDSDTFLTQLERPANNSQAAETDSELRSEFKLTDTEVQEWLREFGGDPTN